MNRFPRGTVVKSDGYYWRPKRGVRIMRLGTTRAEALENFRLYKEGKIQPIHLMPRDEVQALKHSLYYSMRSRAIKKKLEFMSREEFEFMFTRSDGKCEVSGIPFSLDRTIDMRRRPWSPSIDRKDPKQGYALDNCRLVCTIINIAMNEWGHDVLLTAAMALTKKAENAA